MFLNLIVGYNVIRHLHIAIMSFFVGVFLI